jgi:hypothetical protein
MRTHSTCFGIDLFHFHYVTWKKIVLHLVAIQGGAKVTLPKKTIEYLLSVLTKWTDFSATDKVVFIVHIHKKKVGKDCFEVSLWALI